MESAKLTGLHFEVGDNMIKFFDLRGGVSGKSWAIDIRMSANSSVLFEVDKDPISPNVEELIRQDTEAGREHLIDHILLSSRYAVILWLEGRIRREHVEKAIEDDNSITLEGIEFAGKSYKVRIVDERELEYHLCTMDSNGEVV